MALAFGDAAKVGREWLDRFDVIDFAFQPIVDCSNGRVYGVEALLRNYEAAGFRSIDSIFNTAYETKDLFKIDMFLRNKAIEKFVKIPFHKEIRLFYNYDPRTLEMNDYMEYQTEELLDKYSLSHDQLCFDINEKHQIGSYNSFNRVFNNVKNRRIKVSIDNFGSSFSCVEMFFHIEPHYLKFDKLLIKDINSLLKKKVFCSHIISLCKMMNIVTIATGVETEEEFMTCKGLGFNMVQGFFVRSPMLNISFLEPRNSIVQNITLNENRGGTIDTDLIEKSIMKIDTVGIDSDFQEVFEKLHDRRHCNFFPVVDSCFYPVGIIHEKDIKKYVYSPYGKEILINKSISKNIRNFVTTCPIVDISTSQDKIVELYVNNPDSEGVIITKSMKYYGFLSAKSLLNIIHEKNIRYAIEVNPLTKLPGNSMIDKYIEEKSLQPGTKRVFVYFDFDNFKPFNDRFGFRQGDKILLLFAELLKKEFSVYRDSLAGHIGGDDFFAGINLIDESAERVVEHIKSALYKFSDNVASFYAPDEYLAGCYESVDRYGVKREFKLLTTSAAILILDENVKDVSRVLLSEKFAHLKCEAKKSETQVAVGNYSCTEIIDLHNS